MTRGLRALLSAVLFVAGGAAPASATIVNIWGPPGELCHVTAPCTGSFHYPIRQGRTITLDIEGQFVDLSTGLEAQGSGVTVSTAGTSSSHRLIRISVSADAAPGLHTILLHYAVELNGPDRFQIAVLRNGKVTSVNEPSPSSYFNDATVAFQGDNLSNAGVIVLPEKVSAFSVGGAIPSVYTLTHSVGTGSVTSATDGQVNVRFHFDGGPFAEAKATVLLFDKQISADTCLLHRTLCYEGTSANGESTADVVGPNAVSSITFPFGSSVSPGSQVTARVKLVKPVTGRAQIIRFELIPATSFETASGSGIRFSPSTVNTFTIQPGEDQRDVTVQVIGVPDGCRDLCSAQFRTRMVNFDIDEAPFLRTATFSIVKR